jgi:hypothetical protein
MSGCLVYFILFLCIRGHTHGKPTKLSPSITNREHDTVASIPTTSNNNTKRWLESSYVQSYRPLEGGDMNSLDSSQQSFYSDMKQDVKQSTVTAGGTLDETPYGSDLEAYLKPGKI